MLKKHIGFEHDKLIYMEVVGQTHVYFEEPSSIKEPEYIKWEGFAQKQREMAPIGMKSIYQTTGLVWAFISTET